MPLEERNGTMVVAISDPMNTHLIDDIRLVLKQRIEPVVTTPREIQRATKDLYGVGADTMERMMSLQIKHLNFPLHFLHVLRGDNK